MRGVSVITNMDGQERYAWSDTFPTLVEDEHVSRYACLSDAIKDSQAWCNDNWSDGETLDYIMAVIEQLERS